MKARLIRFAFALHRWMGVVLGSLMLLWCLSGFVMIWSPFPSTTLGAREFRWWHLALHRLDIVGSPVREVIVVLLLLGVTAVCGLGVLLAVKKLARRGKLDNLPE